MRISKRNKLINEKVDRTKEYSIDDAIKSLKDNSSVKFVESLDCAIRLGVDPRHATADLDGRRRLCFQNRG